MRRNLRLDWRALALLGALLSIIIDWPGLVYAMPTILPPAAAIAVKAAPTETFNAIKSVQILSFFPADQNNSVVDNHTQQKDSKMKNKFSNNQIKNENSKNVLTTTFKPPTPATTLYAKETIAETKQQPQQRFTMINEKQQVNEKYNIISDKQINDNKQEKRIEETAIYKAHEQQNSQEKQVIESAALEEVSLLNTHTKNSKVNMISLHKSTTKQPTTSTTLTTTESSAKIQSTIMPTTLADHLDEQQPALNNNNNLNTKNILNNFKFSSSHHLAILSRTERSIRSHTSSSISTVNVSSWSVPLVLSGSSSSSSRGSRSSSAVGGVLVRRSSDMSVSKSKRLNNSRNLYHKNNLDRNERSTVSHLSGPSRKIQLFIKNRFIQLLPDGTVHGTQDEQCDYTRDNDDLHDKTNQLHLHWRQQKQ